MPIAAEPPSGPAAPGVPPGFGIGLQRPDLDQRVPAHAHDWPGTTECARDLGPGVGYGLGDDDGFGGGTDDDHRGVAGSVRAIAADAAWRYRSAPLRMRIIADLAAACLVLLLIVGVALAVRQDGGQEQAAADVRPRPTTTASTTTTTVAPTTTTVPTTTTTTVPTTTTTVPPTTTTAAPMVPPPTEAPTTTVPPTTTTTEAVVYRSCRSARSAGALPLFAGEPGYGAHLDSDGDGEACDDFEDWGGGGGRP